LIVDDEPFNVKAMQVILNSIGFPASDCETCFSGTDAIKKVKESLQRNNNYSLDFRLILMDCNMPFKDGYETTKEIRQLLFDSGVTQPIICAVTGHTEPMYVKTAIMSGMNSVFSKPV
jgi:CheY-like chemotaxis protein